MSLPTGLNEKYSFTEVLTTASTTEFTIGFDYYGGTQDAILATLNGVDSVTAGYVLQQLNQNTLELTPAVPEGTLVRIYRITDIDAAWNQFTNGALFFAESMDSNFQQVLNSQQEVRDNFNVLQRDFSGLEDTVLPLVDGLEVALQAAESAATAAGEAADIAVAVQTDIAQKFPNGKLKAVDVLNASTETQQQINDFGGAKWYAKVDGYKLWATVKLDNGDIVKSTVANNIIDPNADMAGWVSFENDQRDRNTVNKATLVSVFDFMTMKQFRDWKDNQETYNVTFALQAALNATNVYECLLPMGTYLHSGLYSDKNNFRFYSNGYARSILKSDSTFAPAIHVSKNSAGVSGFFLEGIKLLGSPEAKCGIQLGDAVKYVQFCNLNNCMIDGFTKSDACDIYLGSVQELDIVNTMSWRGNIGIYKASGGYGTSVKISGKAGYLGRHAKHGIKLDGQIDDIYVQDNVIEGNGLEGIYIANTAFKGTQGVTLHLQNAYLEANGNTGAGLGAVYAEGAADYLKVHKIYSFACNFADNPNAPVGFKNIAGSNVMLDVSGSSNLLPVQIGLSNSFISYNANLTSSSADIFQQLKDLGSVTGNKLMSSGFNYLRSYQNSKNVQANMLSSITFPSSAVLSTDITTLDDYREVGDFVPTVTGHGGTVSASTCRYTKIGNLVNFVIQLTTQNFTSTQGTTKISLPHAQVAGSVAQFINNQSYSGGVAIVASQAVNLPALTAQGSVATIYITGQYITDK